MAIFRQPMSPEMIIVSWFKLQKSSGYSISVWISQGYKKKKSRIFSPLLSKRK